MATITHEKYDWGTLRVIHHGINYKAVLHPEHFELIAAKPRQTVTFTDEQGITWKVTRNHEHVTLTADHRRLDVLFSKLAGHEVIKPSPIGRIALEKDKAEYNGD